MSTRKETTVETEDGVVTVHKLALGDYAEVFKQIQSLPKVVESLQGVDGESMKEQGVAMQIQAVLPALAESWADLAGIIAIATDKDRDFILNLDLSDGMEVVTGVLEVNRISKIFGTVKKLAAAVKAQQTPQATA